MRRFFAIWLLAAVPAGAATLRIHVDRGAERGPLEVRVGEARRTLAAGVTDAIVHDLAGGSHQVIVAGREPLQRLAVTVTVGSGDMRRIDIALPAARTRGRVLLGGVPLAGAGLTIRGRSWETAATTDAKGEVDSGLWQPGVYTVMVEGGALPSSAIASVRIGDTFTIDLPNRVVSGRVLDDRGAPVPHARVVLTSQRDDIKPSVSASTNDKGEFIFGAVAGARQTLAVSAPGYLYADRVPFSMSDADLVHEETVTVSRGYLRPLQLVDGRGAPMGGVTVICAAGGRIRSKAYANEQGRVWLPTPPDVESTAFAIANDGSLAIRRFGRAADETSSAVDRIVMPAASASLELAALTTDGDALADIALLMRYNGELVPPEVAAELRKQKGWQLATGSDGRARLANIPPGVYEFWPYASPAEASMLMDSAVGMAAPINVNVVTGENRATVRFRKRT